MDDVDSPGEAPAEKRARRGRPLAVAAALAVALAGIGAYLLLSGSEDKARGETIRFQTATQAGDHPFTAPADRAGKDRVPLQVAGTATGSGPFGGTGSNRVCDRELLIRSLTRSPERLREWARVLGVSPTKAAVASYIRKLRPSTLTRDTRVTNHTFENGRAVPIQDILQAGTAVLVDEKGTPVARCRCGNPLLKPLRTANEVECVGCPPHYDTANVCTFASNCYTAYPSPPPVKGTGGGACRLSTRSSLTGPADLEIRVEAGHVSCAVAKGILNQYLVGGGVVSGGSGQFAQIGDWLCGRPRPAGGARIVSCERGGDRFVAVRAGSAGSGSGSSGSSAPGSGGAGSSGPGSSATSGAQAKDCPPVDGSPIAQISVRGISCEEARTALRTFRFTGTPSMPGWSCVTLDVSGRFRCTRGAQAIRFSVGD